MKRIITYFIFIFFTFSLIANENTIDNSDDKIKQFEKKRAKVYHKQYLDIKEEQAFKQFYGDIVLYDIFRGDGTKIKLSTLAKEMGNDYLYKNLLWGEAYYGFMAGLIVSIISGVLMDVVGLSFTLLQEKIYTNQNNPFQDNPNLITGVSLLSASIIPITGIFLFSFFMHKAYPYNMNIIQAQSIVNQYNEFLKKKLGITGDILYNYKESTLYFCMNIKL